MAIGDYYFDGIGRVQGDDPIVPSLKRRLEPQPRPTPQPIPRPAKPQPKPSDVVKKPTTKKTKPKSKPKPKPKPVTPTAPVVVPPAPMHIGAQAIRATGTGFDPQYLQNLAIFGAGGAARPSQVMSFNPMAMHSLDQIGQSVGGGNAPLFGAPQTLLEQALKRSKNPNAANPASIIPTPFA